MTRDTHAAQRPEPHPAVDTALLHDRVVLFDERTGRVHELNPSASAVWLLVDGVLSIDEIAAELHELFDVPVATLRTDAATVVADFRNQGLLEHSDPVERDDQHHGRAPTTGTATVPVVLARPPDP